MLVLLSPSKTLEFETSIDVDYFTLPDYLDKSELVVRELRKYSPQKLGKLMNISPKLAQLNVKRFHDWHLPFDSTTGKPAAFVFKGDVYTGLDIERFSSTDLEYVQDHLRILSGLHGILLPLDLIQPYRLEMGTKLKIGKKKNLYEFWSDLVTQHLNDHLHKKGNNLIINLASDEYFKCVKANKIKATIITPSFKEFSNGSYKFMSFYGKKARGLMARFILINKLSSTEDLMAFSEEGYVYNKELSSASQPVFTRG